MNGLSAEDQISYSLTPRAVYKMTAPELIQTDVWHYFIIVAIDESDIYMVMCTTQVDNKIRFFDIKGIDHSTLVHLNPTNENGLEVDSYVDCNEKHQITSNSLVNKLENSQLQYKGKISWVHFLQIRQAIIDSYINDLPEFLLPHPDE